MSFDLLFEFNKPSFFNVDHTLEPGAPLAFAGPIVSSFDDDSFDVSVFLDLPGVGLQTHRFQGLAAPGLAFTSFSATPGSLLLSFTLTAPTATPFTGGSVATFNLTGNFSPAPEPSSLALFGLDSAALWTFRGRSRGPLRR